jgi:NAD(P)-dependent dehydrogenase (short-subunit alcohol dehydrogenase family)
MNVQFHSEQLHAFEFLSYDRNPIHNDPVYARSTQFGRPIVYGMCGVLLGLGHWARARAFRLTRMDGRFAKPLFKFVDYELKIREEGNEVTIQYLEGGNVQMSFRFGWENRETSNGQTAPAQTPSSFRPLAVATDPDLKVALAHWQGLDCSYSIRSESLSQLLPKLCLHPSQMPLEQLNALMGSSYLLGMEVPGRQALYSGFEFEFEPSPAKESSTAAFQFWNVSAELDARFNRISVSGRGSGIRSFTLWAFQRPNLVRYGIKEIHQAGGHSEAFKNNVVFVSGATRGFGSVLTKMIALQDASVFVNYRSSREEAEAIADEVSPWNTKVFPIAGDVSKLDDCKNIRAEIEHRFGRIDLLVSNAFPQIPTQGFLEQNSCEFLRFLEKSVSTTVTLLHELLPLVSKGGTIMLISTCYTREPAARFSHYVASKSCLEGLMRSLASEFPDQNFVIVRPPRMLTDQTNLAFDLSPPVSAVAVARELMESIRQFEYSSNLAELNLGRN